MITRKQALDLSRRVDLLTTRFPAGTLCRYWPGARANEPGREGTLRSAFFFSYAGDIAVFVEGYPGWIAATHVEVDGKPVLEQ
jgi:hypothetical protein